MIKFRPGTDGLGSARVEVRPADLSHQFSVVGIGPAARRARVEQEAEIILRTAHSEARAICDAAHTEGYQAGIEEAACKADVLIRRIEADIAEIHAARSDLIDSVESDLLKLCMEAVEKIVRHEVRTDPRVVTRAVKSCLGRLKGCDGVNVRVSPEEVDAVRSEREQLLGSAEEVRTLNVEEDGRISPGGCVVESASGNLDARIDTQVDQVRRTLVEAFEDEREEPDPGPDEVSPGSDQDGHDSS